MKVLDKRRIHRQFKKSLPVYADNARVQDRMARTLASRLRSILPRRLNRVLEIGCGTGFLTRRLLQNFSIGEFYANDLVPDSERYLPCPEPARRVFLPGDAEHLAVLPGELNLIAANAVLQWFDSLEAGVLKFHSLLAPGGILAFTTFGPDQFLEIAAHAGPGLGFRPLAELEALCARTFELVRLEEERIRLSFPGFRERLAHIKNTGVAALPGPRLSPGARSWIRRGLREERTTPVSLTYHPQYVIARKKT